MTTASAPDRPTTSLDLIDTAVVLADLNALADSQNGSEADLRNAMAQHLKGVLLDGRKRAELMLRREGHGRRCAERLSRLQDHIIKVIYDFARTRLYMANNPSEAEQMAIVAVGGYGRGMLAPGSDIDLLFLLPYKQTAWGESIAETILYCLWDMGLKVGHATRNVDECIRQSRGDLTIRTTILEARLLIGQRALFNELMSRFDKEIVQNGAAEFVTAKLAERDDRHRRSGESRYLVEPNVKDGKGGMRDLHTLFWIAKFAHRVREPDELVARGVFSREEYRLFRRCEDFLWSVRCHLHFLTGRPEERLSFEVQRELAVRLGYTEHPGQKDVERFMKHYFLVAKDVGDLTRIVCANLEEQEAKPQPMLGRFIAKLRPGARRKALPGTSDFVFDRGRINIVDDQVFERDPVNLIRLFHLADKHELQHHPDAMRLATRSLKLIDAGLRENKDANRLFLEVLTSRNDPEEALRRMNEAGVLGRFIPDFGRIVAMMQFNMYHHYTVDEHLLRCIGTLAAIEKGERNDLGLAVELFPTIKRRELVYIAMLLHDIAKGRPEDHSVAGARIARRFGARMGLNAAETDTVAWLVEQHLVMSTVAQSRDLSDRKTIEKFAAVAQNLERLKMLTVLTTADITAVGPGVWNGWKSQLLRTLYYESEPVLTGGFSEVDRAHRVEKAQGEFRAAMGDWPEADVSAYINRHYPAYWLKVDLPRKVEHAHFVRKAEAEGRGLASIASLDPARGVTDLTIFAPDHPRLLSTIAGACSVAGANIVDAQIYTTVDGRALDTITISRAFERDEDELRRATRVTETIEKALRGDATPQEGRERSGGRGRTRPFTLEPEVSINNAWSNRHTVVEITGLDRTGLLHSLTHTLSRLNLNIASAHVATFGERAVDVFYVTDLTGAKITSPQRQSAIRRALLAIFEPTDS